MTLLFRHVVSTDPPYYNNIDYADLSDFFYIWLRRSLREYYPGLFDTVAVPKTAEIVASPYRCDGSKERANECFEVALHKAFVQIRDAQNSQFPFSVFYAFKQAELDDVERIDEEEGEAIVSTGWETMLGGL